MHTEQTIEAKIPFCPPPARCPPMLKECDLKGVFPGLTCGPKPERPKPPPKLLNPNGSFVSIGS